jgi:hypothetical protein
VRRIENGSVEPFPALQSADPQRLRPTRGGVGCSQEVVFLAYREAAQPVYAGSSGTVQPEIRAAET